MAQGVRFACLSIACYAWYFVGFADFLPYLYGLSRNAVHGDNQYDFPVGFAAWDWEFYPTFPRNDVRAVAWEYVDSFFVLLRVDNAVYFDG